MEPTVSQDRFNLVPEAYVRASDETVLVDAQSASPYVDSANEETTHRGGFANWTRHHKLGLAVSAAAVATVASLSMQPAGETLDQMKEAGPWVGAGLIGGESAFIGGTALMLAGMGERIRNPLNIRKQYGELRYKVADSKLFKTGFYVNAVGSLATTATASAAVAMEMPRAWPLIAIGAADMASTVWTRRTIFKEMNPNQGKQQEGDVNE